MFIIIICYISYGVDCVVANLLQNRYDEVRLVEKCDVDVIKRTESPTITNIEEEFIMKLVRKHKEYISA